MTRAIQIGTVTIQGRAATYEENGVECGAIPSMGCVYMGPLPESIRSAKDRPLQTTADRIWGEFCRLSTEDDRVPRRLRITGDVLRTLKAECGRDGYFSDQVWSLANPEDRRFMSMPVEEVPVGSLDAPGWQIMVTEGRA